MSEDPGERCYGIIEDLIQLKWHDGSKVARPVMARQNSFDSAHAVYVKNPLSLASVKEMSFRGTWAARRQTMLSKGEVFQTPIEFAEAVRLALTNTLRYHWNARKHRDLRLRCVRLLDAFEAAGFEHHVPSAGHQGDAEVHKHPPAVCKSLK